MNSLGGRKFIFTVLCLLISAVFVLMNKLSAEAFITFANILGATYVIGNVAQKAVVKEE